jgi:hypothetical protein
VVDEGPLAVDLDDGDPFPVGGLEAWDAGDVRLGVRDPLGVENRPSAVAQVAALRGVENDDARDRYRG